jgi:hypothetical protein
MKYDKTPMFLSFKSAFLYCCLLYNMWQNEAEEGIFAARKDKLKRDSITVVKKT